MHWWMKRAIGQNGHTPHNVHVRVYVGDDPERENGETEIYADGKMVDLSEYSDFVTQGLKIGFVRFHGSMYTGNNGYFDGGLSERAFRGGNVCVKTPMNYFMTDFTRTS